MQVHKAETERGTWHFQQRHHRRRTLIFFPCPKPPLEDCGKKLTRQIHRIFSLPFCPPSLQLATCCSHCQCLSSSYRQSSDAECNKSSKSPDEGTEGGNENSSNLSDQLLATFLKGGFWANPSKHQSACTHPETGRRLTRCEREQRFTLIGRRGVVQHHDTGRKFK